MRLVLSQQCINYNILIKFVKTISPQIINKSYPQLWITMWITFTNHLKLD